MGHVHRHAKVGPEPVGGGDRAGTVGLLLGRAQDHQVHIQLLSLQQLQGPEQQHKAGPVVQGLAAQKVLTQGKTPRPVNGRGADGNGLGLVFRKAQVQIQFRDRLGFVHVLPALDVRRQTGHHAKPGRIGEDGELPVGEHPGVNAPQRGKAEVTLLLPGDDKTDLVQVGVQQDLFGPRLAAGPQAHHIAHAVQIGLPHQGAQHIQRHTGHRPLKPAGAGGGGETVDSGKIVQRSLPPWQLPYSSWTSFLNTWPRSIKFLKWSKAAQAGDSTTTSPGFAAWRAAATAAARSSVSARIMPLSA